MLEKIKFIVLNVIKIMKLLMKIVIYSIFRIVKHINQTIFDNKNIIRIKYF